MKILTTLKRIPDPEQKVKFKGAGAEMAVDLTAANWVPNQFDEYAVETALRLTENASAGNARLGEVVVASIGPKEVTQQLRSALGMGADRAILVAGGDDNLDGEVVARTVVALVAQEKPDLVLVGKLSADSEGCQVAQLVAGYLGWPQAMFAAGIEVVDGSKALIVHREADSGTETKRVPLPAVVSVDLRIVAPQAVKNGVTAPTHAYPDQPRYVALKGIMAAKKKPLLETTLDALGVKASPRVKTTAVEAPATRKAGIKVGSVTELVAKLHDEAKVL